MRCRGSLRLHTDGGFGRDNAGLCDEEVGLEGCSLRAARLGPHPHGPVGGLSERAHPCVIVQRFTHTSWCQAVMGGNSRELRSLLSLETSLNSQSVKAEQLS